MRRPLRVFLLAAAALQGGVPARAAESAGLERGQAIYAVRCAMSHGATGDGFADVFPPLAQSDWLAANRKGSIEAVVAGLNREIVVNGRTYRGQMPPVIIDDDEVAAVLTFVVSS